MTNDVIREPYEPLQLARAKGPLKKQVVKEAVLSIWKEYDFRLTSAFIEGPFRSTKNETAKNFLRREIYALGFYIRNNKPKSWKIRDLVNSSRQNKTTRPEILSRTFHSLFMCVYSEDDQISRSERSIMARELEYAYRHKIPSELLCGFLYQSGGRNGLREKIKMKYREPAFRKSKENGV